LDSEQLLHQSEALACQQDRLEGRKNDPRRLLLGEDPASTYLEDAMHWTQVYGELARFKQLLLRQIAERIRENDGTAVAEELGHDLAVMQIEMERVQLHLAFWRDRIPADGADGKE
jgi:hypothetical protein